MPVGSHTTHQWSNQQSQSTLVLSVHPSTCQTDIKKPVIGDQIIQAQLFIMQTSGSARKLHDTFRMLHVSVSSVLAPSQLIRNRCCTSSSSSSSCSRGGSSSCYGVLPTVGSTAAVSGNRLPGRLYATDAAVSSTAGQEAKQLEPALYVVVSHFWP